MDAGIDTGDMLLTGKIEIAENDNFEIVHDKLGECSAEVLLKTMQALKDGKLNPIKQDESGATYAAKIENADCVLDFSQSAHVLHNRIRGLSPIPLAYTRTPDGKMLKIVETRVSESGNQGKAPGEVLSLAGGKITVACGEGAIRFAAVIPEGKGRMSAGDFVRGRKINVGEILK